MCNKPFPPIGRRSVLGFSLVELMVGIVIALIATIVIFQVFAVSESYKRATTGGSDAMQSGGFAAYTLGRLIGAGGSGFGSAPGAIGCPLRVFRNKTQLFPEQVSAPKLPAPFDVISALKVALTPVLIVAGATPEAPDVIVVMAGSHSTVGRHLSVASQGDDTITLAGDSLVGINNTVDADNNAQHDLLLAVDQDAGAARGASTTCDIAEVTSTTGTSGTPPTSINLKTTTGFGGDDYFKAASTNYSMSLNISNLGPVSSTDPVPGSGPPFVALGVGDDGTTPNALLSLNLLTGYCPAKGTGCAAEKTWVPQSLADNIVSVKALYGIANTPVDIPVTAWVDPTATGWDAATLLDGSAASADKLRQIRAVRVAVIARNAQPEKLADDDSADTPRFSPATFSLFEGAKDSADKSLTMSVKNPDRHYRYKVFETTVPLRNMILMPQSL